MKNVLVNVKESIKKFMEKKPIQSKKEIAFKLIKNIATASIILLPHVAFAADPTGMVNAGIKTVTLFILGISVGAGGLALGFQGLQYHWAGDARDKAEIVKNMKGTVLIAGLIGLGPMLISWIYDLFKTL